MTRDTERDAIVRASHEPVQSPVRGVSAATDPGRRRFLRTAGLAGAAAGLAGGAGTLVAERGSDVSNDAASAKPAFRETDYVRTYYALARW